MPGPPVEGGGRGWLARPIATKGQNAAFIRCQNASAGPSAGAAIGASLGGTRVFTATNAQGLLFMAEHLYTASGSRRPIVMAVVSRGVSVPHTRYADHNDALAVNRAGWIQVFCEDAQEVLETCLHLCEACEDRRVRLPGMFCYESFIHSNTAEGVAVPDAAGVTEIDSRNTLERQATAVERMFREGEGSRP